MEKVKVETSIRFLLHCLAFARPLRPNHLGTFAESEDVGKTDISRLNKFVLGLKRFVEL